MKHGDPKIKNAKLNAFLILDFAIYNMHSAIAIAAGENLNKLYDVEQATALVYKIFVTFGFMTENYVWIYDFCV